MVRSGVNGRHILRPALTIALYDVGLIGGLLASFAIPGVGMYGPTVGLLVTASLQIGILIPNLIAVGMGSVGAIFDTAIASYLPDMAAFPLSRMP